MNICADDPDTFLGNGEYHFEEQVEMNLLGPRIAVKARWRMAIRRRECTTLLHTIHGEIGGGERERKRKKKRESMGG